MSIFESLDSSFRKAINYESFNFYNTVIVIAIIILIIILIFIGHNLNKDSMNKIYPPVVSNCPDYWEQDSSDLKNIKCLNVNNLGNSNTEKVKSFSDSIWKGKVGLCTKSIWAERNNLSWDGITNNPNICDNDNE